MFEQLTLMLMFFVVGIDKKVEKIYTSARKQMLISSLPPVITLHLKRFHQVSTGCLYLPSILSCQMVDMMQLCLFFCMSETATVCGPCVVVCRPKC